MIVTLDIKDEVLAALLERSSSTSSTVEELLNTLLASALDQPMTETVDHQQVIKLALTKVQRLPAGQEFTLDDVIDQDAWQIMSTGDRKSLGKAFRKQAEASGLAAWSYRNSSNKAIYTRQI
jgi:hypothetical protein